MILQETEKVIETPKTPEINTFKDYTKEFEKDYANVEEIKKDIIEIIQNSQKIEKAVIDKIEVIEKTVTEQIKKIEKITQEIIHSKEVITSPINNKPKLAIIIDDVTLQSQINNIKKINQSCKYYSNAIF